MDPFSTCIRLEADLGTGIKFPRQRKPRGSRSVVLCPTKTRRHLRAGPPGPDCRQAQGHWLSLRAPQGITGEPQEGGSRGTCGCRQERAPGQLGQKGPKAQAGGPAARRAEVGGCHRVRSPSGSTGQRQEGQVQAGASGPPPPAATRACRQSPPCGREAQRQKARPKATQCVGSPAHLLPPWPPTGNDDIG